MDEDCLYKDDSGWYFNSANQPCAADDADRKATVTLDKTAKSLIAAVTPEAGGGTSLQLNVGFAKTVRILTITFVLHLICQ